MKSGFIISNHKLMIWNQDLLYQIMNVWFENRIYYIKSQTYDLRSRFIISNHKCACMIWNKNLLYQIKHVWYHVAKLYLVNNEKNYKIKLNHFFYKRRPISPTPNERETTASNRSFLWINRRPAPWTNKLTLNWWN